MKVLLFSKNGKQQDMDKITIEYLKQQVANNKFEELFKDLFEQLGNHLSIKKDKRISGICDALSIISRNFKNINSANAQGVIDHRDYFVESNKITHALISTINSIPDYFFDVHSGSLSDSMPPDDLLLSIVELLDKSKIYNNHLQKYRYQLKDDDINQIYDWIATISIETEQGKKEIEEIIFKILNQADYDLTLIVSEFLTSLIIKSNRYNWLVSKMIEHKDWNIVLAGIRTYSKLAEIDENLVDISELIKTSLKLDSKTFLNQDEKIVSIHLIRTIGKINRSSNGFSILKFLACKGQVSKEIVINAIPFDFAKNGPIFMTNLLINKSKRTVTSIPPDKQQIDILGQLSRDINDSVRTLANKALVEIAQKWNIDVEYNKSIQLKVPKFKEGSVKFGYGTPFSGYLLRINPQNQEALQENLPQGTVALIETRNTFEFLFSHASGIIVDDEASLSHRCIRLIGSNVPFASINFSYLADIPDGSFISVNDSSFEADISKPMI